jgi:serine/threonine protein kinase
MPDNTLSSTIITKQTIANYRLVELKGSGGMANVFKAIQLSLDRPVAMKIMHPHLNTSEAFISRFEKEAKRAAMLQHENIVSIIDYGCDEGQYYIAMEYIDGTNLIEIMKRQSKLPLEICLHICHQVAEGLKYAHKSGLVHRDIKPANIMMSYDGRVMITDFGIAKSNQDHTVTSAGQVIGSPSYMSPEQAAGKSIDHRSDIFSLGIILYEILGGEKPFKGDTYQSLITSIMSERPTPLRQLRSDVTPEIDLLVQQALVKDLDSRYQSAEEFSEALFAQLAKFKISSFRKVMSDYLKNPIRTTEKLRIDKISDHMESALYFLAVGEGKLAEAKKEFQEVLRFDKKNTSARKYLSVLESQPILQKPSAGPRRKNHFIYVLYIAVILGIIGLSAFLLAIQPSNEMVSSRPPIILYPASSQVPALPDASDASNNTADQNRDLRAGKIQSGGSNSIAATSTDSGRLPKSIKPDLMAYNYPDQRISRFGLLSVKTNILANLVIDDKRYGLSNGPPIKLSPGHHRLILSATGYRGTRADIFLKRDQGDTLKIRLALKK